MSSKDIRETALKFLAHRDHTVFEMKKHLKDKEFNQNEIEEVVSNLLELKYLDDYGYCRKYIPYSANKGKGKQRIKTELIHKGIHHEVIENAIDDEGLEGEALSTSELDRALRQGEKTMGDQEITEKLMAKVGRRLSTLGYASDVVFKVIGILMRRNGGNSDD